MTWPKPKTPECPSCHRELDGWVPRAYYTQLTDAYIALLKSTGNIPQEVGTDGLTPVQREAVAAYCKDMEENVIPEIVATIRERAILAAKTRNWVLV